MLRESGIYVEAEQILGKALELARNRGDRVDEGNILTIFGRIHSHRYRVAEAERLERETLAIAREMKDRRWGEA